MLKRPTLILPLLCVLTLLAVTAFMTIGAKGSWSFILSFRGTKLAAMILVAYSVAVSTVLFQTVTNNRILTPSIMGFDALYILIQTLVVFFFGAVQIDWLGPNVRFLAETAIMAVFAGTLYYWLFSGAARSLHLVMLVGIVCGVFFRSISNLMQRMLDPNLFAVLQDRFFASFNTINSDILIISVVIVAAISLYGLRFIYVFDVLSLGRDPAINLGVDHQPIVRKILFVVTVLVSVSTALVGPITFFGLLVANLAYMLAGSAKHRFILPIAILLAILCIVGGQTILERVFSFNTALSVIIEFLGGLVFIILLVRGHAR
ncbi:enterobactin ABC transporter permease [Ochrobactrum sp. POC9]|uniref:iron chelate uptake ABC transporter family permease subunit n=1 Tax=unclassified Ochrobactrum TaxID=239106 RepID=UPI000D708C20|nr:iron chelate uptake ABC transporter family permease subunit [Ochrobactrum sp. POC9]MCH4542505.1 iron chelate uptake ABC transporter family permease subunit [Ochrobactrum sp. A-1]PWU76349.1 enterobactin ABC transporter permease [Ochrobactrum sp. POC9]